MVTKSKQEAALSAPDGSGRPTESPLSSDGAAAAWDKVRRLSLDQLDRMLRLVPKILRAGEPRHVHEFRVASRRFQQAFDLLIAPPAPSPLRRLRRKIKRARRALSDVRNCDVFIQRVEARLARRRLGHRKAWNTVLEYLRERRSNARSQALRKVTKLNLGKVYIRLQSVFAAGAPPAKANGDADFSAAASATKGTLEQQLAKELGKAWEGFKAQTLRSQESPDGKSIHQARIAGKKLRYLIEVMRALEIPGCRDVIGWLRKLQQFLGDWHDLDVAEQMIAEMLARPEFLRDNLEITAEIVRLIAQERKAKSHLLIRCLETGLSSPGGARLQDWVGDLLTRTPQEK